MGGYIYKITTPHSTQCYVGHTTKKTVNKRFSAHKNHYLRYLNGEKGNYVSSFKLLELGDCKIECLEVVQDEDKLPEREQYWFSQFDCVNKQVPNRTNKDSCKNWYQKNKEKQNQKIICEICDRNYTYANKSRHFKTKKHREAFANTSIA